jgi:C1A family cysteine protease
MEEKEEVEEKKTYSFGWLPDYPDFRDYTEKSENIKPMLEKTSVLGGSPRSNPSVDLRMWFSPVEDQKSLGSCTANAAVGIMEYYQRRAFRKHIDASRLFLYKATRDLMHLTGDTGAYLRTTMKALVLFGAPPEEYWPYTGGCLPIHFQD